jgi:hypothetical protein
MLNRRQYRPVSELITPPRAGALQDHDQSLKSLLVLVVKPVEQRAVDVEDANDFPLVTDGDYDLRVGRAVAGNVSGE